METKKRILISELPLKIGQTVLLKGWVEVIREQGSISFVILRDISGRVQLVAFDETKDFVKDLTVESVVEIEGIVTEEKQAFSGIEIKLSSIQVLSKAMSPLPISPFTKHVKPVKQSKRLNYRWLDLKEEKKRLIFEIWTEMEKAFVTHLVSKDFIRIHTPNIMSSSSESGSELFELKYFGKKAYLAQSCQFYKQMAMSAGFEKIFSIGPVFRANKSFTPRHDTEFTQYDIEASFIDSHLEIMDMEEDFIIAMLTAIKTKYSVKIKELYGLEITVPVKPFPQITLLDAKKYLKKFKIETDRKFDLCPEEERTLGEYFQQEFKHQFVFVTDWPKEERAFYHMRYSDKPGITKGFDLLYKGLEITTGAQREHRYDVLCKQAFEKGYTLDSLGQYLKFFAYGCPPHGGLGFGPSRFLMQILGIDNVREVTYLYRGVKRITP